jgi:hypothetical protein
MQEITEKMDSLVQYRDALPGEDRQASRFLAGPKMGPLSGAPDNRVDRLMEFARARVVACARASKLTVLESMLLAMMIEQQKIIERAQ